MEYHAEFKKLAHGLLLYNPAIDDTIFITRFIGGLRDDIRSALLLHKPGDVDTTSALALIQEQELEQSCKQPSGRDFTREAPRVQASAEKNKQAKPRADSDDKLASLKSFHRRNGLCFKCGEKWNPSHQCPLIFLCMCWRRFWMH
jgi:hypothetical protein